MPALFPPWSNHALRLVLVLVMLFALATVTLPMIYVRTPFATEKDFEHEQPVAFDHRHHVLDDGIACLYCHSGAERSPAAGVPGTDVCMGCHAQIWNDTPLLAPVRQSAATGTPLRWDRVHALADFVYFDHSVHVRGGIDCARCHGPVESMARVRRVHAFTMDFCLDCHRHPPARPTARMSALTTCSACHR
ncbi:MAG TPA: cytochrome c3 family protein [Polyangiaceae bacterium]|jgi:hypothetical protein|nr:cytochrome c3 family protein [Polyangiaceae bacterium]